MMFIGWGLGFSANAETPPLSLPPLPSIPGAPSPALPAVPSAEINQAATNKMPSVPTLDAPAAPLPELPALPGTTAAQTKPTGLPPLSLPPAEPSKTTVADDSAAFGKPAATDVPTLPGVEVEAPATADITKPGEMPAVPGLPGIPSLLGADAAPDVQLPPQPTKLAQSDKDKKNSDAKAGEDTGKAGSRKSWQTTLAPTVVIPKTNFNYKRELLPGSIYRNEYARENRHLPRRMTREDYATLLFNSVAKNDLEATRALLNAGAGIGAINPYGETPLELARRMGAMEVAALLVARGGR